MSVALAYVVPLAIIALTTLVLAPLRDIVPNDLVALAYVLVVILVADLGPTVRGWWVAPLSAVLVLDYFFARPFESFLVSSPHDMVMLGLFIAVGIISSRQVARLRHRTREAEERQHDLKLLNALSAALISSMTLEDMSHSLRETLRRVGIRRVVLFVAEPSGDGCLKLAPYGDVVGTSELRTAESVARENKAIGIPRVLDATGSSEPWPVSGQAESTDVPHEAFIPLLSPSRVDGVLFADAGADQPTLIDAESRLIVSAANLATIFLERRELQKQASAVALMLESDRLKSNLLSAVSHDIKTPLAAAKAHVTHLLVGDVVGSDEEQASELLATADALDRLGGIVDDLIDLSRLESDGWRQKLEQCEPGEILSAVLSKLGPESARVQVDLSAAPPTMLVDFGQMERAVRNLVANALLYSTGSVRVEVALERRGLVIEVEDEGPGVPDAEKTDVLKKFYRGSTSRGTPGGSGLGLAIVGEVARAHGGTVTVEDAAPHGTRFSIVFPPQAAR
jgi:two-component system sensor histidine kinase KdpD